MSEGKFVCQRRTPPTIDTAIDALTSAIEFVLTYDSRSAWSTLYETLVLFKDPLEGGSFSTANIESCFFLILASDELRRVHMLTHIPQNTWNSHAIEAASCVWLRIADIIACSHEVVLENSSGSKQLKCN